MNGQECPPLIKRRLSSTLQPYPHEAVKFNELPPVLVNSMTSSNPVCHPVWPEEHWLFRPKVADVRCRCFGFLDSSECFHS